MFDNRLYKEFDKKLLLAVYVIFLSGLFVLYSATQAKGLPFTESYVVRQTSWMLIGTALLFAVVGVSYQRFIDAAYILYGINIFLLFLVSIIGHVRLGAQRWFSIGSFAFQPSEFIKITMILALASYIGQKKDVMKDMKSLFIPLVILGIPFVLVLTQPDLGTASLLSMIFFSLLVAGGASWKHLGTMASLGLAAVPFFWHFLHGYQKQRLLVFLNPDIDPLGAGYTIIQSKIAIGSGGLFGKGWLSGTQNQLNFLPERHTDFIFSIVGEEWGFLGAVFLIAMYIFVIRRALRIASLTSDIYGKIVASGIAIMLSLQIVINIAMTIGVMPVVGIPLPLVSYGGSSLVSTFIAIGLLLNIEMRRSTF